MKCCCVCIHVHFSRVECALGCVNILLTLLFLYCVLLWAHIITYKQ